MRAAAPRVRTSGSRDPGRGEGIRAPPPCWLGAEDSKERAAAILHPGRGLRGAGAGSLPAAAFASALVRAPARDVNKTLIKTGGR